MFLDFEIVRRSLDELSSFHPFFGITFLVCKLDDLPVGTSRPFEINAEEKRFLESFYKPDPHSEFFFQPFRTSSREGRWLSPKYPFSGSQSTRTRGDFAAAFFHDKGTKIWGWQPSYVNVLRKKLTTDKSGRIPVFWLAVWLYRNHDFGIAPNGEDIVSRFLEEFKITDEERDELFRVGVPDVLGNIWSDLSYTDSMLMRVVEPPPDGQPDEGATLRKLQIRGTGPVDLTIEPGQRLSIVTGDNGLGKSFILECAWWALTGEWAERPAVPREGKLPSQSAEIRVSISNLHQGSRSQVLKYDVLNGRWPTSRPKHSIPGLIIYARVDGSFAIWDPARHQIGESGGASIFSREKVIDGDPETRKIEGLIRDWISWQRDTSSDVFALFSRVLRKLSPPDMAPLEAGTPMRVVGDIRTIPTLRHDYAEVPFTLESAGVKRIITIAYLLVWAWNEHRVAATQKGKEPEKSITVMIDEMESHLHPKWQRVVLPSLLDVMAYLGEDVQAQLIVATHSPLVLASCEEVFSEEVDKLFHLSLEAGSVEFTELPFLRHGTVDSWLTSDIFRLKEPRSTRGEDSVERVRLLMEEEAPNPDEIMEANRALKRVLPEDDELWARWLFFARYHGVRL
jgi:hypothetical protein